MPGLYDAVSKRDRYEKLRAALWTDRSSFDAHWQDIANNLLPRRARFYSSDRNKGDKRNQNIIDSTARFAHRTLQSGMHAGLTSPARPWFKLTTPDPKLAEFKPVKEWLHVVTQRMSVVFNDCNLYNTLPIVYGDMGGFGTAAMGVLEDSKDLFRCYAYPLGSYVLGMDERGVATTFIREYQLTVRQIVKEFGVRRGVNEPTGRPMIDWSNISITVKKLWEESNYEAPVDLCWVVAPNDDADPGRPFARYMPWTSCYYEKGGNGGTFLRESGFRTFPILAPRWDITGEDSYGTDCPGMTALGDIRQLQIQQKDKGRAIKKGIDPPVAASPELRSAKTSLLPADITYVRNPETSIRAIHEVRLDLSHLAEDMQEVRYRIQRAFYEDLFLMLASSDQRLGADRPTAREVEERHEEKLLALGPVLERTNDELLDPLIDRVYALMAQNEMLPEPPEELDGIDLKVEYISIMAQAQKMVGLVGQDRFMGSVIPMMEAFPETRHKINVFQVVDNYGEMNGVDPRIVRSNEEATASAQQEAEAQQAAAEAEQTQALARAAKDASSTPMGQDSALDRVVGGLAAAG